MRILLANGTYPPDVDGSAYFTKRLAEGLVQRGHEVHILAASTGRRTETVGRDGVVERRLRSLPVPFHTSFRFSPPLLYRRALAEVRRVRPDVVHAQGHFFIGRAAIRAAKELGIRVLAERRRRLAAPAARGPAGAVAGGPVSGARPARARPGAGTQKQTHPTSRETRSARGEGR